MKAVKNDTRDCRCCGRPVRISGTTSADGPLCQPCRKLPDRLCLYCGSGFRVRSAKQACCSQTCAEKFKASWNAASTCRVVKVDEL